jgi:hypothetical protein
MKPLVCALIAGVLLSADLLSAGLAFACSGAELTEKQKAFAAAAKARFDRDPGGDAGRQAQVQTIINRYMDLQKSTNGRNAFDLLCKENDELLAIYK